MNARAKIQTTDAAKLKIAKRNIFFREFGNEKITHISSALRPPLTTPKQKPSTPTSEMCKSHFINHSNIKNHSIKLGLVLEFKMRYHNCSYFASEHYELGI